MTVFGGIHTSDHRCLFIDVKEEAFLTINIISIPSPFERKLQSLTVIALRTYKKYLQFDIIKKKDKQRLEKVYKIDI